MNNNITMVTLALYPSNLLKYSTWSNNSSYFSYSLCKAYFSRGLIKPFTKGLLRWRPALETQFNRGLEYWSYQNALRSVSNNNVLSTKVVKLAKTPFFNLTLHDQRYIAVYLSQKYNRVVLTHLLNLLLRPWQIWRNNFSYSYQVIPYHANFQLLRFINTRFFKIYTT